MSILLPLYVYPWPGVWDPLYWAAGNNTNLKFNVILNPCSGPCMGSLPEPAYIDEIPKLKNHPNIRTLGYVATNYTDKVLDSVLSEIRQWASWPMLMNDTRMSVDGIFFDEIPGLYHWQKHDYLKATTNAVQASEHLGEKLIIHNPGTLPDPVWNYLDLANTTVIFEDTFANFIEATKFNALKNFHTATNLPTSAFSIMLHSIGSIPDELVTWTVMQMKHMAEWNFATNVATAGEYWHSFPTIFELFIKRYAQLNEVDEDNLEAE
ncbi:hypothetical protein DPSP01_006415 [Paraphaeosphaeria sporulosa]|uniref:Spherulation-specific family 4 n=1 Tax=Paraphaeosphaeria sporulosa TaxID=1460663 RepID=A0A177BUT9_9PLEO|nr:uncharacterized protein CC84DRAFT_1105576 [Paraphaeosphaeria sporulosa]OAF98740.1 hypothetical protein CC84DRAFT_1105576 [Paraphaeosphaeria sporulosa]